MTRKTAEFPLTFKRAQQTLGLSRTVVSGLIDAGFVTPARGPRNELQFTFRDLMLLRTAHALQAAKISPRKILRSLVKLKAELPSELPLTGLRISAVGSDVVVRDRMGQRSAESGQLLMDFEVAEVAGEVAFIAAKTTPPDDVTHIRLFREAESLEPSNSKLAEASYRQALELVPTYTNAYLNLGALLCDAGRCDEAVELYSRAVVRLPDEPLVRFNQAIALEDQQRLPEALEAYEAAIRLDPLLADAHFNAGRLLEQVGDSQGALRHFSAYRRLKRQ